MTMGAGDQMVIGLINGGIALIDACKLQMQRVLERVHTGTVVACCALRSMDREIVITQDDSREIKVWNINDMSIPLIKTVGRSYNPVWYSQSLCELQIEGVEKKVAYILSGCGSENKVIQYKIDLNMKTLTGV